MTTIRMEAVITDDSYGSNDYHMDVTSDVPPEAGPWDDWGYVADVFKHIIEALDGQHNELCFVDSITLYVDDLELVMVEPEADTDDDAAHKLLALMVAWDSIPPATACGPTLG